ncbi:hypothetical protein M8J77_026145 [Diaphorina citri]|nr:hypothetical protein M8J77_026145 [Diaphorina citri]
MQFLGNASGNNLIAPMSNISYCVHGWILKFKLLWLNSLNSLHSEEDPYWSNTRVMKTQWIGINQIIEDLAFEASVAMFIGLIEDLQVQGQQGQHLTFHI